MATCRLCEKGGVFSSVDANGLCKACAERFHGAMTEVDQRVRHTLFLINKSTDPDEKLRRSPKLFEHLESLVEFEELGLPALVASRQKEFENLRDGSLLESVVQATQKDLDRATLARTWTEKKERAEGVLSRLEEAREGFPDPEVLESLKEKARGFLSAARLDAMVEKCHEAEDQGRDDLALERYRATWEFLQQEEIDHPGKSKIAVSVQERVRRLEAKGDLSIGK